MEYGVDVVVHNNSEQTYTLDLLAMFAKVDVPNTMPDVPAGQSTQFKTTGCDAAVVDAFYSWCTNHSVPTGDAGMRITATMVAPQ